MNIYKKSKMGGGGGGAVKTDKDFCHRNEPKKFELQLFRAFDVFNIVILYPTKLHKFFSFSRFAGRHTEKYIIITDMY